MRDVNDVLLLGRLGQAGKFGLDFARPESKGLLHSSLYPLFPVFLDGCNFFGQVCVRFRLQQEVVAHRQY